MGQQLKREENTAKGRKIERIAKDDGRGLKWWNKNIK